MSTEIIVAASVGGAVFLLLIIFVVLVICLRLRRKRARQSRGKGFDNNIQGTQYVHNSVSNANLKAIDLEKNHTQQKQNEMGNYALNVTNTFVQNGIIGFNKKCEVDNCGKIKDKRDSQTDKIHEISETIEEMNDKPPSVKAVDTLQGTRIKNGIGSDIRVKNVGGKQNVPTGTDNLAGNDDEPIVFTEESLKVFETSGLTKEENKIIEALDDTLSGFVNAAFDDSGDPLGREQPEGGDVIEEETRPGSRSSSTSNQSGSDKPGIMRPDSENKRLKRPNSVSFQLPDNHVDKQTNGQYSTRTLPVSGRGQGYKRVLASKFYSYRPQSSGWSTQDFVQDSSHEEVRPVIPRKTESLSKKSIGPFNASFSEWLRKKPKGSVKLKPVQTSMKPEAEVKLSLPTHSKKRATILDTDSANLISKLEVNGVQHLERDFKLSNHPYIMQEIGNSSPEGEKEKGDNFLY